MSTATIDPPALESAEGTPVGEGHPSWYAGALTGAAVAGSWLVTPWSRHIMAQTPDGPAQGASTAVALIYGTVVTALVSYLLVRLGLGLGRRLGLGWPALRAWRAPWRSEGSVRDALALSALLAIPLSGAIAGLSALPALPEDPAFVADLVSPPWFVALSASIGAGIIEEIWLRLGVMTLFAAALAGIAREALPRSAVVWGANVLAALVFGAMHLPLAARLGPLTLAVVAFVLLGNGVVGVVCGWLYWRLGIVAAMVWHASVDVVLKVLIPLFVPGAD